MSRNRISKAISSFLVLAITVSLFGCENTENGMTETVETEISFTETTQISEDTVTVSEETSEVVLPLETEPTESDLAVEEEIPEAYKQILDLSRYLLIPRTEYIESINISDAFVGLYEVASFGAQDNVGSECYLDEVMYAIYDMDGNGIDELVIFDIDESGESSLWNNRITALYTLDHNGEVVLVRYGWSRSRWYLLEDGRFFHNGSSGASYTDYGIFEWSDDGLSLIATDIYYSEQFDIEGSNDFYIGWYHSNDENDLWNDEGNAEYIGADFELPEDYFSMTIGFENAKPFSTWTHTYEFFEDDVTWEAASQMCQDNGGHLVTIESESELQTLTTIMSWYELTSNIYCVGGLNIGDDVNGIYVWRTYFSGVTDTDVTIDSALWRTGEPSLTGLTEDGRMVVEPYVAMLYSDSIGTCNLMDVPNDLLDAAPSYSGYIGYVCEYE